MPGVFSLDVRRARKGDCLLLHYGTKKEPKLALVDGGPTNVYRPHLKPRLEELRKARGVAANKPLILDFLMVSHVDDDHIQGILELMGELKTAQMEKRPQLVKALGVWHNSFDNVIGSTPKELTASFAAGFTASVEGDPESKTLDVPVADDVEDEEVLWNIRALASIKQGAQLRSDAQQLKFAINPAFKGKLIVATAKGKAQDMGGGLKLTVIGPMEAEIKALHADHQKWLESLKKEGKKPEDVLAAYVDNSVANLSSVVVLAEAGKKRILLTGDARGDKVLKGLELVGLVKKGGSLHVDVLKGPHHGSSNNLDVDFFQRISADHYVFSGDGEHGNPERESLEMLLKARGDKDDYQVHLTYPIKEIDVERKKDWEKEQGKEKAKIAKAKKAGKKSKTIVRANWSPAKNSLAALLKANPKFAKKFQFIGGDTERHVIDLLDKLDV
jgi:beta-lactamase superfamily II metal-dependent hydrolase